MKKKLIPFLSLLCLCLCLTGCNKRDAIEIYNRSPFIFDDIQIYTKDGYFYHSHEKFTVDDSTIGVTVYFSKITTEEDDWENEK